MDPVDCSRRRGARQGHTGAMVDMGDYPLLVTGDGLDTFRHLAPDQIQAVRFTKAAGDEQVGSIRRIAALRSPVSELHLLIGHDHHE